MAQTHTCEGPLRFNVSMSTFPLRFSDWGQQVQVIDFTESTYGQANDIDK